MTTNNESATLTKRELLAAVAMHGVLCCDQYKIASGGSFNIAKASVKLADELMDAMNRPTAPQTGGKDD